MQVFNTETATPSAAYITLEDKTRPYLVFGNPETGGLAADDWAGMLAWLREARRAVEWQMRSGTPMVCEKTGDVHEWVLVEAGYERRWRTPGVVEHEDSGEVDVVVNVDQSSDSWGEDGESSFLYCNLCGKEANADNVNFL